MSVISLLKTPVLNDFMQFCDILIECLHSTSEGFMTFCLNFPTL